MKKLRAAQNRTITLSEDDFKIYADKLIEIKKAAKHKDILNKIIHQDIFEVLDLLPENFVDLLIIDPPYNLDKTFKNTSFKKMDSDKYAQWFESWFVKILPTLKNTASVYVCCDWQSSAVIHTVMSKHSKIRNRITWEREKGRGAKKNFKNSSEDIFFATVSDDYCFNLDQVKIKRRVLAPYTDDAGRPKDWQKTPHGQFRLTHPSNFWNDITIPFWSMPENTDHPTQKSEKLMAKLILASTNEGDLILDPFMGAGSSIVTAKKLGRNFIGIEAEKEYCLLAAKRLHLADKNKSIQGYGDGVFWERNSLSLQRSKKKKQ